jgi:hypothetical protein
MATFELQEDVFAIEASHETDVEPVARGSRLDSWREELATYLREMVQFKNMDPVEVFLRLSAFSARASEIRNTIVCSDNRRWTAFRTQAIDPFLDECDRQFRIHSRVQATREMEFRMSGGHV